ncbi:MAG: GGDEF domain-containing protein [Candidatus Wenzhouxiangella sp. M2_3B_020]
MPIFEWNRSFVTGLETVDEQHRHLVDLINSLGHRSASNDVSGGDLDALFRELIDYADYHFAEEEALMDQVGIDARHIRSHRENHRRFLREVELLRQEGNGTESRHHAPAVLDYLVHWLTYHILGQDQDMARQIGKVDAGIDPAEAFDAEETRHDESVEPLLRALGGLLSQLSERNRELLDLNRLLESRVAERTRELSEANETLRALSLKDPLTDLSNRRHAMMQLDAVFADSCASGQPVCALMIDADHFKAVNDVHGHDAGDTVLKILARTLEHSVRTDDLVFRLGGDEFLVLCPATDFDGGMQVAHQLLASVERLDIEVGDGRWRGSVSIGIASADRQDARSAELLRSADRALYRAKKAGRGCAVSSSDRVPRAAGNA